MTLSDQTVIPRSTWDELVSGANIPALLMIAVQLSPDPRWSTPEFRPTRTAGMEEHDDGGLPSDVQDQIRQAAAAGLDAVARGELEARCPDAATMQQMMSVCMGEDVTPEFADLLVAQWDLVMGATTSERGSVQVRTGSSDHSTVLVVGAGVSSLSLSRELGLRGIDHVIAEKSSRVGGAWRDNHYPGCGVDTPSHIYSHTYYPYDWSKYFAKRDEVFDYMSSFSRNHGVDERVQFDREVVRMEWDETDLVWNVLLRDPEGRESTRTASIVVGATGQLNIPKVPNLPGRDRFAGESFHSAEWPDGLDIRDARVAIIGSGASAMQIVPKIVDEADSVVIFQRSPQWIAFNPHYFADIGDSTRRLLMESPLYRFWFRARQSWVHSDKVHPSLFKDDEWTREHQGSINKTNDGHRRLYERYLRERLGDRTDLIEKSLPDYPPFGKRMLLDNGWFDALLRDDVELVSDAAVALTEGGVVSSAGEERAADVVVFATGFESLKLLHPIEVRGREGRDLHQVWGPDDAQAYLGMAVHGFPNLFLLCGPNTNLGHGGSWIQVAEFQADYIAQAVASFIERDARSVEVPRELQDAYVAEVDRLHEQMIWTYPGMRNWYRNAAGRVVTNTPWRIVDYWSMTRVFDPEVYEWDR